MSTIKLDHVPLLESAQNFPEWKRFITQVLQAEGHWSHIEGTDGQFDIFPKSMEPAKCTAASDEDEKARFKEWWQDDMKVRAIMLRRISPVTHSHLDTSVEKTARSLWEALHTLYARTDILAQFDLRDRLSNAKLRDYHDVGRYLGEFKDARLRFLAMNVAYSEFEMVHHIIRGIPDSGAWGHFRQLMTQTMQDHVERENRLAADSKSDPDTLLDQITTRLTIECQRLEFENSFRPRPRQGPGSEYSNFSPDDNAIRKHAHNPNGVQCTNCGQCSHDRDHCYRDGGGMAGQGPRAKAAAAKKGGAGKSTSSKTDLAALTDAESFLNALGDDGELSCASITDDAPEELAELVVNIWSTLLDSGATSHLIKKRDLFWTYNEEAARNVKTANLGVLQTRASGTCVVLFTYNGISTKVILRDCLHAPHAFVNLLSVRRFVAAGVSCMFEKGRVVLSKAGKSFGNGPMVNKLFILEVEFLMPPITGVTVQVGPLLAVELPSRSELAFFAKVPETLDLWHYRMGHPGEPATLALLKSTTGASFVPGKPLTKCEPCIFGKQARLPAPTSQTPRTTNLLELIHLDICGPFPVATPHGKAYFVLFLDDASSVVNLQNLMLRSEVRDAWRILKAKWELKTGKKVKRVRFDGAGELGGCIEFLEELALGGIEVEVVAAYEHWKNGRIERYMRTIQGKIHAMLVTAQLPMTYWGEAVLTAAYLQNLTSTSTLPNGVTPFEVFYGRKPDVSHLRVWGTRCFAMVPQE